MPKIYISLNLTYQCFDINTHEHEGHGWSQQNQILFLTLSDFLKMYLDDTGLNAKKICHHE